LEAYNLIESLVGVPPINVVKTEITLGEVIEKLSSLEKSLPNLLNNASQVNESIESISKRITILEASTIHDSQNIRIGKLEEAMETLGSAFSSLKFKKEKAFVGKELPPAHQSSNPRFDICVSHKCGILFQWEATFPSIARRPW
jgi:hypothetical protein